MKTLLLVSIVVVLTLSLTAVPVDYATASNVAVNWLTHQNVLRDTVTEIEKTASYIHMINDQVIFYVFNFDPEGFVIVAGDDASLPILGYNTKGTTTLGEFNCNIASFFSSYEQAILDIHDRKLPNTETISEWDAILSNRFSAPESNRSVGPLMATEWDQDYPWNAFCPPDPEGPGGHALAGCVATAMGQIMKYWSYPNQGNGSHSYYHHIYGQLSANFGETTYNWANMPNTTSTNATAELLFHLGVSVDMNYGADGSGAFCQHARDSFVDYFRYHPDAQLVWRNNYTFDEWLNVIKNQLDNLRPMYYSGEGSEGGHAFVCDGYDANNHLHFNWGWSGYYNGFYQINNLTPGNHDFSYDQNAIINTYPEESGHVHVLFDNFESHNDFALQFLPWTLVDLDQSPTYGFQNVTFPNSGSAMAFIIFNPSQTTPPLDFEAYSGDKMAASFAAVSPPNNDWMITPELQLGTNSTLSFWARSYTAQWGLERMKVGISTTNNQPSSFTFITESPYVQVPVDWTEYSFDLSAWDNQSIWVAINCVSNDAFILFIDDFSLSSEHVGIDDTEIIASSAAQLRGNYPNPFNPETTIAFDLKTSGLVSIDVFNIRGQKVATLVNDYLEPGSHHVVWNGKTDHNREAGSGIYFYRMKTSNYSATKKMILMK